MKKTIGGDRLGSGKKMEVALHNYERSTHNLSRDWRSTMSVGTLVPCFVDVALNGDTWDIDINSLIKTQPTNLPTFGSFKFQVDVFECPIRLYNGLLHNNMQRIGMDMSKVLFPTIEYAIPAERADETENPKQFSNDSLMYYLGVKGVGLRQPGNQIQVQSRKFNAVPLLAYYDIFKNYYANKQEENAYVIDSNSSVLVKSQRIESKSLLASDFEIDNCEITNGLIAIRARGTEGTVETNWQSYWDIFFNEAYKGKAAIVLNIIYADGRSIPAYSKKVDIDENFDIDFTPVNNGAIENSFKVIMGAVATDKKIYIEVSLGTAIAYNPYGEGVTETGDAIWGFELFVNFEDAGEISSGSTITEPVISSFPLENLDQMRIDILRKTGLNQAINITDASPMPYSVNAEKLAGELSTKYKPYSSQVGLMLKTYQSDIFNNWLSSEWIEGANGIAELTAIDTSSGSFTMDTLNLSQKVYNMLNRIAVSGGSYEDWQEAVYGEDAIRRAESPIYCGGMSCEIAFEEVVSSATSGDQPLGTLGGKGKALGHKGGNITIKVKEPSFIIAIASITPRIDYYEGNKWWATELKTMNDLHKPALDGIGFQNLMSEQMAWWTYNPRTDSSKAIGKIPAWLNYMTAVNETFGKFAGKGTEEFNESAMVINRSYDSILEDGNLEIADATTYIDPKKYNYLWAVDDLTSQYFYVQLGFKAIARRKMSAKVIPNL